MDHFCPKLKAVAGWESSNCARWQYASMTEAHPSAPLTNLEVSEQKGLGWEGWFRNLGQ